MWAIRGPNVVLLWKAGVAPVQRGHRQTKVAFEIPHLPTVVLHQQHHVVIPQQWFPWTIRWALMPHGELPAMIGDQRDQAFAIAATWILRQPPDIFLAVIWLVVLLKVRLISGTSGCISMFVVHAADRQATERDVESGAHGYGNSGFFQMLPA